MYFVSKQSELYFDGHQRNLYNNVTKPYTTVGADPFYAQTSGPRPSKILQADPKLAAEDK
jgi:hypothetical protein